MQTVLCTKIAQPLIIEWILQNWIRRQPLLRDSYWHSSSMAIIVSIFYILCEQQLVLCNAEAMKTMKNSKKELSTLSIKCRPHKIIQIVYLLLMRFLCYNTTLHRSNSKSKSSSLISNSCERSAIKSTPNSTNTLIIYRFLLLF